MGRYILRRVIAAVVVSLLLAALWAGIRALGATSPLPGRTTTPHPTTQR